MSEWQLGLVKWFGGYNKKTLKENNYGFVCDLLERDFYLHAKNWHGTSLPEESDLVAFTSVEKDGKHSALEACRASDANISCGELWNQLGAILELPMNSTNFQLCRKLEQLLCSTLNKASEEEAKNILGGGTVDIFEIIKRHPSSLVNFSHLVEVSGLRITDHPFWENLPQSLFSRYEVEIADSLSRLSSQEFSEKAESLQAHLPPSLATYLAIRGAYSSFTGNDQAAHIFEYMKGALIEGNQLPNYLQVAFDADRDKNHGKMTNPLINDIVDNLLFKRSLYEKTADFISIYQGSTRLKENIDTFVLYNIISLFVAGNEKDVVYTIFLQRLWEEITQGSIAIHRQATKLKKLFPRCNTMPSNLSCEAVYWEKNNIFICRSKQCRNPQILPNTQKNYFEYSIYDWLSHYGINYLVDARPASKDFPIKLAGYFNRIREIYEVIHCHSCGKLMLPDMRYSRTEYKQIENGVVVTKNMAAAYRLTVFHCNDCNCSEFDKGHYISHCIGGGCYEIIDSRSSKLKCDSGRHICKGC